METLHLFSDIPHIHVAEDGPLNPGSSWAAFGSELNNQMNYSRQAGSKLVTVFGTTIPMDENNTQDMSSMQRFLHGPERPPFAPEYLHTDFSARYGNMFRNQHFDHSRSFEPQSPWPTFDDHRRPASPDETIWSASSVTWSASPHDELHSANINALSSVRGPSDFSRHGLPYAENSNFGVYSADLCSGGGSVALREIQYAPDEEPEQPVEEYDRAEMKIEYGYEQEAPFCKMEVESDHYEDSGLGDSIRGESVQPIPREESDSDEEYKPSATSPNMRRRKRRASQCSIGSITKNSSKRSLHGRKTSSASATLNLNKVKKSRSANTSPITSTVPSNIGNNTNAARPFPCTLAPYSCTSTFASKNEWKRHMSTQHVRLGFWRCDLCPTTHDSANSSTLYYNDFNRKDLFTQHLRRMHAPPANQAGRNNNREYPVSEDNLPQHQERCYQALRKPPPSSSCLFCDRDFSGPGSWEERMEHVGRHMEKDRKTGGAPIDMKDWRDDEALRGWLITEGLIEPGRNGGWRLGDGRPKRDAEGDEGDDMDANIEDDEDVRGGIKLEC